ncbi:hypothetical protein BH24CHL8_BH24CHL8_10110 [soil metagenome]
MGGDVDGWPASVGGGVAAGVEAGGAAGAAGGSTVAMDAGVGGAMDAGARAGATHAIATRRRVPPIAAIGDLDRAARFTHRMLWLSRLDCTALSIPPLTAIFP